MRSTDRTLSRPIPATAAILATLLLALAACTSETGASVAASASAEASTASMEASAEASAEMSTEESAEASDGGGATTVMLTNFEFDPTEITVSAGDTVTFMNHDSAAHTVTEGQNGNAADGARFDDQVAGGASVEVTFDEAGDYDVTCLFHANMNMVVHVE
jgi:plastocyanin